MGELQDLFREYQLRKALLKSILLHQGWDRQDLDQMSLKELTRVMVVDSPRASGTSL